MTDPTVIVEVAFTTPPGTPDDQVVWEAVTSDVRSISPVRGRPHELDKYSAGTLTIVLGNLSRQYDPTNLAGPHVSSGATLVLPMRRVRVRTSGSVTAPIFDGYADGWKQSYDGHDATVELTATDGFKILTRANLTGSPFSVDALKTVQPVYWFRLGEAALSTTAIDQITGASLVRKGNGTFGNPGLIALDADTAYTQAGSTTLDRLTSATIGVISTGTGQWLQMRQTRPSEDDYNMVSTPDTAAPDNLAAMDFRFQLDMPSLSKAGGRFLLGKSGYSATSGWSVNMQTNAIGSYLIFYDFPVSGTGGGAVSPQYIPMAPGLTKVWVAVTVSWASPTGGVKFYYNTSAAPAADVTTWPSLGVANLPSAKTDSGSNALLPTIGAQGAFSTTNSSQGGSALQEPIYKVQVRSSVNGTLIYNPDFSDAAQWTVGAAGSATGTDSTGKVWTIRNSAGGSPSPTITGPTQPFTFSAWITRTATPDAIGTGRVLAQGGSDATGWIVQTDSGSNVVQFSLSSGGTSTIQVANTLLVAGQTYHVVCTYDSTGVMRTYVNGVLDVTAVSTSLRTLSVSGLSLGNLRSPSAPTLGVGQNWSGTIDEVQIFNTDLSAAMVLSLYQAGSNPWNADLPNTRISRILDAVGWPTLLRDLDVGVEPLQPAALTGDALSYVQTAAQSELFGSFFITRDGKAAFRNRARLFDQSIVATFSDASAANNPVMNLTPEYGDWLLRNDVTITRAGGADGNWTDGTSIAAYLDQGYSLTGLMHSQDSDSVAAARLLVKAYSQPQLRVNQVVVNMRAAGVTQSDVLGLELGSWINLVWKPRNSGTQITLTCVVEQIKHNIDNAQKVWTVTLSLSPALTLGHMKYQGKLGSSTSTLNTAITTTNATSISVAHSGASWTDSFQPFTIRIDSEEMTVTAVVTSTGASPQTFTVVRGVNGTTAATHLIAATVALAQSSKLILA